MAFRIYGSGFEVKDTDGNIIDDLNGDGSNRSLDIRISTTR